MSDQINAYFKNLLVGLEIMVTEIKMKQNAKGRACPRRLMAV